MYHRKMKPGYVYLIVNPDDENGYVKVGFTTKDPEVRLKQWREKSGNPNLQMIHTIKSNDAHRAEKEIHWNNSGCRIQRYMESREWFNLPQEVLDSLLQCSNAIVEYHKESPEGIDGIVNFLSTKD